MTRTGAGVSESAGATSVAKALLWDASLAAVSRRLADIPPVVWTGALRLGPVCLALGIGWKPSIDREVETS